MICGGWGGGGVKISYFTLVWEYEGEKIASHRQWRVACCVRSQLLPELILNPCHLIFCKIYIKMQKSYWWKGHLKMSSAKCCPCCSDLILLLFFLPGPCLNSTIKTSASGQMLTGCETQIVAFPISETPEALFTLCSWTDVSAVGFYTDDTKTEPAQGNYYKCKPGETLRLAPCNLAAIRHYSGICYTTYVKPEYFSP